MPVITYGGVSGEASGEASTGRQVGEARQTPAAKSKIVTQNRNFGTRWIFFGPQSKFSWKNQIFRFCVLRLRTQPK
jgi:hypothetical protein